MRFSQYIIRTRKIDGGLHYLQCSCGWLSSYFSTMVYAMQLRQDHETKYH